MSYRQLLTPGEFQARTTSSLALVVRFDGFGVLGKRASGGDAYALQHGGRGADAGDACLELIGSDEGCEKEPPGGDLCGEYGAEQGQRAREGEYCSIDVHVRNRVPQLWEKVMLGRSRRSQWGVAQAARPARRSITGSRTSRTRKASRSTAMPRMTPISLGGSGPDRAKVKKTATMTPPAAKMTRPEWATAPTMASRGSPDFSQCSLAEASRKTV